MRALVRRLLGRGGGGRRRVRRQGVGEEVPALRDEEQMLEEHRPEEVQKDPAVIAAYLGDEEGLALDAD